MGQIASISRGVLSDQVKDYLLRAIIAGDFPPGSRIVETRVARELGVSQAPVREALRDLEALGVVEITAFQGARVRHPDKAELLEAYGVRAELESLGVKLALHRLSDADLEELQGYIDEMERAASAGDRHAEALVDAAFHAKVIDISANHTLRRVWRYLEPVSRTYITLVVPGVNVREIADLHQPILDALRRRDFDLADAAVRRHFSMVGSMFASMFVAADASVEDNVADATPTRGQARLLEAPVGGALAGGGRQP